MAVTWESPASCPSLGGILNSNRGPQSETLWDLDVAKSDCHILSSLRGEDKQIPPRLREMSTKLQNKGHIHWCTKQSEVDGAEGIMLHWIHKVWGKGGSQDACFAFHEKGHTTVTLGGKYSYPLPQSIILSFYPQCIAKWIKDTLSSSKNSFCTPLSSCSTGIVGNVTHHWIRNVLKGGSEKKYPLIGFTDPLTRQLREQRHARPEWIKRIKL